MSLHDVFRYDPDTGKLYRRKVENRWGLYDCPEEEITSLSMKGYIYVQHRGYKYFGHRLAWYLTYEKWPRMIDHINGVKTDNRLCNLRDCNQSENSHNARRRVKNRVGYTGVQRHGERYRAFITKEYRTKYLGTFDNAEEASRVYLAAKEEIQNV